MELQQPSLNVHLPSARTTFQAPSRLARLMRFAVITYLLGVVILSVEQFLALPQNLASVDFWNLLFLPVCWLYLIYMQRPLRFPYALGMWLIVLGSFIGTFSSYNAVTSIIFIAKEIYLYVWFITLVSVLASLEPGLVRHILLVWLAVALVQGVVLIAQFTSGGFNQFWISFIGRIGNVDPRYLGRPAGFFEDPVWAALFQLLGFVPLLLGGLRRELSLFWGMLLVSSILATASLGALTSLLGASLVAVFLFLLIGGHLKSLVWLATVLTIAVGLFLFALSLSPDLLASLQHLTTDRAAHTAGERLHLWSGGTDVLFSAESILGVGPNNYRDFLENKTLHNDFLEFGVERGIIGLIGLALLASEALNSALKILRNQIKSGNLASRSGVIFLAMLFGILLEANAHQIFHFRSVWLALAMLEATRFRMLISPLAQKVALHVEFQGARTPSSELAFPLTNHRDRSTVEVG